MSFLAILYSTMRDHVKRADILVWNGDPLSVYSSPSQVFVDGVERWNMASPVDPWSDFSIGPEVSK